MDANGFKLHPQLQADSVAVGSFALSELRLLNDARYLWLLLIPRVEGFLQWHELNPENFALSHEEMRTVANQVQISPDVERLNFGALGNLVPQLHLHVVGRHSGDAAWPGPVWGVGEAVPYTPPAMQQRIGWLRSGLQSLT